jgi:drug/metabolite transporter (DMT)-like permease
MRQLRATSPHTTAVFQAFGVTFLWALSWVLIKIGLADIPALTFAGLRYSLAFLCLLPLFWRAGGLHDVRALARADWLLLLALGVVYYTVTQGAQFVALALAPAVTTSLILSFTAVFVALLGIPLLGERPLPWQWLGMLAALGGALLYFYPALLPAGTLWGIVAAAVGMLANSLAAIMGRSVNRRRKLRPLTVTVVSMGVGSALLLAGGLALQGLPPLNWRNWLLIAWLAVVHTAVAFTLWNHTLRTLSAMESTVINNSLAVQIPILAVLFLGERLAGLDVVGLALVIAGTFIVQMRPKS